MKKLSDIKDKNNVTTAKISVKPESTQKSKTFEWNTNLFYALIVALFAFIIYANTLTHDYALDDLITTTDNVLVQKGIDGIPDIFSKGYYFGNTGRNDAGYRPISLVLLAIQTEIAGNNPHLNHWMNVLYYTLLCFLLFFVLAKLLKNYPAWMPFIISLLYATHAIHTEVVANIKSSDELLQLLFILLTIRFLLVYIEKKDIKQYIFSLLFYMLALLSKENAITFIAIFPLLLYFFTDTRFKKIAFTTLPYLALALLSLGIRVSVLDSLSFSNEINIFQNSLLAADSKLEYYTTNFVIHLKYILLLIFPNSLSWDYSYNQIPVVGLFNIQTIISLLVFLLLATIAVLGFIKKKPVAFGILWYVISLSIASNFVVTLETQMGERFLFTPSLGFIFAGVFMIYDVVILKTKTDARTQKYIIFSVIALFVLFNVVKTVIRNNDWKDNETIFLSGIKTAPNSARTHMTLGAFYRSKFQKEENQVLKISYFEKATAEFKKSLEIYPDNPEVYYDMGFLYYSSQQKDTALIIFKKGLELDSLHVNILNYTGIIFTEKGQYQEGLKYFEKVKKTDPKHIHAHNNAAYVYIQLKDYPNAIKNYEKLLQLQPTASVYRQMAIVYVSDNNPLKAIEYYEKSLEYDQSDKGVFTDLMNLYKKTGNNEKAEYYRKKAEN